MDDACCVCGGKQNLSEGPDGKLVRELRPYGPGGKPICFPCAMGDPSRKAEAERQLMSAIGGAGDVVEIGVGHAPRPASSDAPA